MTEVRTSAVAPRHLVTNPVTYSSLTFMPSELQASFRGEQKGTRDLNSLHHIKLTLHQIVSWSSPLPLYVHSSVQQTKHSLSCLPGTGCGHAGYGEQRGIGKCMLEQSNQARREGLQREICCEHPGHTPDPAPPPLHPGWSILEGASWTQPGAMHCALASAAPCW